MYKQKYFRNRNCLYCGVEFTYPAQQDDRRYCSRSCGSKGSYNRKPGRVWEHDKHVFEAAMELYWSGVESASIARQLNIPVGTIYSWVHDFGSSRERKEPLKKLLCTAKSAEEWRSALRENTVNVARADKPIYLVCGMFQGFSAERFTSIIFERLNENPLSGNSYAFCNKTRNTITTFAWEPPVFHVAKHIKMHGTFLWPGENLGRGIEVTRAEFDRLLLLHKQGEIAEKISKNLEIMRV